jgi:hypothetical protein
MVCNGHGSTEYYIRDLQLRIELRKARLALHSQKLWSWRRCPFLSTFCITMDTKTAASTKTSEYQTMSTSDTAPVAVPAKDYEAVHAGDVGRVDLLQGGLGPKRGHKFCGGCCDVRRAVIIVNMVVGGLLLWGMIATLVLKANVDAMTATMDDDTKIATLNEFRDASILPLAIGWSITSAACVLGIVGAIQYNVYMVGAAALKFCVDIVYALITFNIFGVALSAFFLYPHVFFIKEVREGIMSKVNYDNERQSCCCV